MVSNFWYIISAPWYQEYAPIGGEADFCTASAKLALGEDSAVVRDGLNVTIQVGDGRNTGIWNSSKLRYSQTIFSYLLTFFKYCKNNFHNCKKNI